jgi:HSP20 family protein
MHGEMIAVSSLRRLSSLQEARETGGFKMAMDRRRIRAGYVPLRDAIDQLFEGSFITPGSFSGQSGHPAVDLYVSDDDVVLEMALPGADPDDINVSVTGDTVTLSGEVKRLQRREKSQSFLDEIWEGKFQRSFQLPVRVDANAADASYNNGILVLRLPKSEATKPRKIQVKQQQSAISGESVGTS